MMNNHTEDMEEIMEENKALNSDEVKEILAPEPVNPQVSLEGEVEVPPVEVPQEKTKESAGAVLKKARKSRGLSLEIVHEGTKIPLDALRAIEEGYTIRMLSPFYYKGFLKMYADYLGISVSEVIEDYRQEQLPEHIDQEVEEFEVPQWITKIFTRERKQKMVIAAGILLALFLLIKLIGFFIHRKPSTDVKKAEVKTEAVKKTVEKKAVVKKKPVKKAVRREAPKKVIPKAVVKPKPKAVKPPVSAPIKAASVVPASIVQRNITLTVRAAKNSWLRVKADDDIVFQSTLRIGAVETWVADDEIEISGKNIDQLEFELNGKMIGTLGRKDRNAKKVVITKSGLSVKN